MTVNGDIEPWGGGARISDNGKGLLIEIAHDETEKTVNEQQKAELEDEMKSEAKATLVDFLDHQQRALTATSKACEALGTPQFESHLKVAGATSLAGFRLLVRNFSEMAAVCKEEGLCEEEAASRVEQDCTPEKPKRKRGMRLRVHVNPD